MCDGLLKRNNKSEQKLTLSIKHLILSNKICMFLWQLALPSPRFCKNKALVSTNCALHSYLQCPVNKNLQFFTQLHGTTNGHLQFLHIKRLFCSQKGQYPRDKFTPKHFCHSPIIFWNARNPNPLAGPKWEIGEHSQRTLNGENISRRNSIP